MDTLGADSKSLEELERLASPLDFDAADRGPIWEEVRRYCEQYLDYLSTAPGYSQLTDMGAGLLESPFSEEGIPLSEALSMLDRSVDRQGHNVAAAGFLSYIPVSPVFPSMLGDVLAAVSSRYAGQVNAGPGAVRMEHMVLRWMADIVGFPETSAGNLASGGSLANLIGIVVGRTVSGVKARDFERSVIYMTEHTHHCVDKSLAVAGLSESIVRKVPTDGSLRMDVGALDQLVSSDILAGLRPLIIVANAGTTDSGAVDPLDPIADVAERHKVWFHVDGSYGGLFAMTAEGKAVLKGIERCDSLALDPPKGLYVPWGCGVALIRHGDHLYETFKGQGAYMLDVAIPRDEISPSDLSPELSKLSRGLRIWLPLKLIGTAPYVAAMQEKLALARYAWERLGEMDGFERGPAPDLSIVLFRARPKQGDANALNRRIVEAVQKDGRIHISSTRIGGMVYLRFAILGFRTHKTSIDLALELLERFASELATNEA